MSAPVEMRFSIGRYELVARGDSARNRVDLCWSPCWPVTMTGTERDLLRDANVIIGRVFGLREGRFERWRVLPADPLAEGHQEAI